LEEIKQDGCKEVLQNLFGLSSDVLQDTFSRLDKNRDKIISIEEGQAASQSLERSDKAVNAVKDTVNKLTGNSNDKPTITFGSKVLVVTGGRFATEIIDLENSKFACTKVGKFPKKLYTANGGLVGNIPMVCGGFDGSHFQKSCYSLQENGAWKEDEKAKLVRGKESHISGSVVINNQIFIPEYEGHIRGYGYLNFEIVVPSKETVTLKPYNKYGTEGIQKSCIVKWDANTIMLIGVNSLEKETFFINMGNQTLTEGPNLMEGRRSHACHEMTINGEPHIIVSGGYGVKSTEILSKSSFGKGWQKGPEAPIELRYHQMVASSDKTKLYTIGNLSHDKNKKIFEFSCTEKCKNCPFTKCKWTEMATKLKEGRFGAVAFPISDELTKKICN